MEDMNDSCTAISSQDIQLLQSFIATYRKKLKEAAFVQEEFLYKKIGKKDVYVDYGATTDILQDAVKQYTGMAWRFDSIEVGETNYYYYSYVSQQHSFESFFVFSLVLMGMQDLILLFPRPSFCNFVSFSLAMYASCYIPTFI